MSFTQFIKQNEFSGHSGILNGELDVLAAVVSRFHTEHTGDSEKPQTERRISCHRCGNIRKKRIVCSHASCPHTFCGRCCEKMKEDYGDLIFVDGCPVCKELCCCSNKSMDCDRKNHCYRKCPASKTLGNSGNKQFESESCAEECANPEVEQLSDGEGQVNDEIYSDSSPVVSNIDSADIIDLKDGVFDVLADVAEKRKNDDVVQRFDSQYFANTVYQYADSDTADLLFVEQCAKHVLPLAADSLSRQMSPLFAKKRKLLSQDFNKTQQLNSLYGSFFGFGEQQTAGTNTMRPHIAAVDVLSAVSLAQGSKVFNTSSSSTKSAKSSSTSALSSSSSVKTQHQQQQGHKDQSDARRRREAAGVDGYTFNRANVLGVVDTVDGAAVAAVAARKFGSQVNTCPLNSDTVVQASDSEVAWSLTDWLQMAAVKSVDKATATGSSRSISAATSTTSISTKGSDLALTPETHTTAANVAVGSVIKPSPARLDSNKIHSPKAAAAVTTTKQVKSTNTSINKAITGKKSITVTDATRNTTAKKRSDSVGSYYSSSLNDPIDLLALVSSYSSQLPSSSPTFDSSSSMFLGRQQELITRST